MSNAIEWNTRNGERMNCKLLITDIDDTLVYNARPVSKRNAFAINRAQNAGVYVMLATGRSYLGAKRVVRELNLDTLVITYGGAVIVDPKTESPLFVTELDDSYIKEILDMAEELGLHAHIYKNDCVIYEKNSPYVEMYTKALNLPHCLDKDIRLKYWTEVPKVLIITEQEKVKGLLPIFRERFEGRVHVSESSPGFIEFNKMGINKGTASEMVAERLGFLREQTVAIGDNTLDYELIKWAGIGAVVENGNATVKAVADVIIPSCRDDGVAWFIDNYVMNGIK